MNQNYKLFSVSLGPHLDESHLLEIVLEHRTELEEPKVMGRHLPVNLQGVPIHHQQLPNRNAVLRSQVMHVLVGLLRQFAHQHNTHPTRIARQTELTCTVVYLSVLVQLVELEVVTLNLHHGLDVTVDERLAVLYLLVPEGKVDETVTQLDFSNDQLQFAVAAHFSDGLVHRDEGSFQGFRFGRRSLHCRHGLDIQTYRFRRFIVFNVGFVLVQHRPRVVSTRIDLVSPSSLKRRDMRPASHTTFITNTQLSLGVVTATVDIALFSQTQGVIGTSSHHYYHFAQKRLRQHRFVFVFSYSQTELPLRSVPADVDMPLIGEDDGMFPSKSHLFDPRLLFQPGSKVILNGD